MDPRLIVISAAVLSMLAACDRPPETASAYELENYADTLAMNMVEAWGGKAVWESVRYLQFEFANERAGERTPSRKHFWDRFDGDYRLEWVQNDSQMVALFNTNTREGTVYANGEPLADERQRQLLDQSYARFINDTYWLMAPAKVFDPGVNRSFVADSSDGDVQVLHLSFEDVGLTPGDQYWLYATTDDYLVNRWSYRLQGWGERDPATLRWTGYESFQSPRGPVQIATRKESLDGAGAILTDRIRLPEQPPNGIFQEPGPLL